MTTMDIADFIELGFNKNEAKVYLTLIKFKQADANTLTKKTKFHKNIIYDNLEKLIDKGLVSFIIEGGKKVFSISPPDLLQEYFEEQQDRLDKKKRLAKKLSKEISLSTKETFERQGAIVSRGVKAIKSFYNEALKNGNYVVFGAPKESLEIMGETFWRNYNLKRTKKRISVKMIFNPSIKDFGNSIKDKFTSIKYFDKDFEPLTETHIQKNRIGIIVWTKEPIVFAIKDKNTAESYLKYFETMWKHSRK